MWLILHTRPRGTTSSTRIPLTTGQDVPLQVLSSNAPTLPPSLERVENDLALVPLTSIATSNTEVADRFNSTSSQTDGVIYSEPPRENPTSAPPSNTAPVFAQTASGYFADISDNFSDSFASSTAELTKTCKLINWLKTNYFIFPWNYLWLSLTKLAFLLWIGFFMTFFLLIHGNYLPERSTVELVDESYKLIFLLKVRRDLSFVNISAIPIPDGIVWDKATFDIYGPTEVIQIPYVFKHSMNDVIIPRVVSDDWRVKTVDSMMTKLQYFTVFESEDVYQFKENYGDMFCYHYYRHHFIHRASTPKTIFNYTQRGHCTTPS
ncbi:uncharacterized protein [Pleurodeles waltl]|uniref:uncharacterized protein n=1 Tax=Pleurodeles waltl TaxID=8319 RepID=UPI003709A239